MISVPADFITVVEMSREDLLVGCPINEREKDSHRPTLSLAKVTVFPDIKVQKSLLGHKDEKKLFASPMVQTMVDFCKLNCETRLQAVEVEILAEEKQHPISNTNSNNTQPMSLNMSSTSASSNPTTNGNNGKRSKVESLKLLRPLNLSKFLSRDKNYVAHEVEDSIIFLTKSDLEKMESEKQQKQLKTNETPTQTDAKNLSDKLKVFEQEKKSWFSDRKKKNKTKSFTSYDLLNKKMATDRYCDMSKMLQERFGDMSLATNNATTNNRQQSTSTVNKSSSVTDVSSRDISNFLFDSRFSLNKTFSLENISFYDMKPRSRHSLATSQTPDLVRIINRQRFIDSSSEQLNQSSYPTTSSSHGSSGVAIEPQSFISEKLYSEFHVKTKQHSKSSTNLNKWHFGMANPAVSSAVRQPERIIENRTPTELSDPRNGLLPRSNQPSSISTVIITADSPYSLAQDSLVDQRPASATAAATAIGRRRSFNRSMTDIYPKEFITTNTDEFYAEICNNHSNFHTEITVSHS